MNQHPKCQEWIERSQRVLAGGPATLSKLPSRYPQGIAPGVLSSCYGGVERRNGAYVTCPDGIRYVDLVAGLGPVILGHADAAVTLAVMEQAEHFACSTLSTPLECEVAEMLCDLIPGVEQVRFACNGKDVTEAAVKVARHVTGRDHVIYCGYAGGFPDYLSTTNKCGGVLPFLAEYNHQVPWRDFDAVEKVFGFMEVSLERNDLAAIILEVPPEASGIEMNDTTATINRYKDMAHARGGLCILDEIVTGLRYAIGGAQEYYGVEADLITMSKALGNGLPIAAILGKRDLMQVFEGGRVFLSTTFGASPISLAAAKATLIELQSSHGQRQLRTWGEALHRQIVHAFQDCGLSATIRGNFARMVIDWHDIPGVATAAELRTLWLQEMAKRNILIGVPIFPMCCYDEGIVDDILDAVSDSIPWMMVESRSQVLKRLEVPVIDEIFQRYVSVETPDV